MSILNKKISFTSDDEHFPKNYFNRNLSQAILLNVQAIESPPKLSKTLFNHFLEPGPDDIKRRSSFSSSFLTFKTKLKISTQGENSFRMKLNDDKNIDLMTEVIKSPLLKNSSKKNYKKVSRINRIVRKAEKKYAIAKKEGFIISYLESEYLKDFFKTSMNLISKNIEESNRIGNTYDPKKKTFVESIPEFINQVQKSSSKRFKTDKLTSLTYLGLTNSKFKIDKSAEKNNFEIKVNNNVVQDFNLDSSQKKSIKNPIEIRKINSQNNEDVRSIDNDHILNENPISNFSKNLKISSKKLGKILNPQKINHRETLLDIILPSEDSNDSQSHNKLDEFIVDECTKYNFEYLKYEKPEILCETKLLSNLESYDKDQKKKEKYPKFDLKKPKINNNSQQILKKNDNDDEKSIDKLKLIEQNYDEFTSNATKLIKEWTKAKKIDSNINLHSLANTKTEKNKKFALKTFSTLNFKTKKPKNLNSDNKMFELTEFNRSPMSNKKRQTLMSQTESSAFREGLLRMNKFVDSNRKPKLKLMNIMKKIQNFSLEFSEESSRFKKLENHITSENMNTRFLNDKRKFKEFKDFLGSES